MLQHTIVSVNMLSLRLILVLSLAGMWDAAWGKVACGEIVISNVARTVSAVATPFGSPGETHTSALPGPFIETAENLWAFGTSSASVISGQESLTPNPIGSGLTGLGINVGQVVVGFGAGGGWSGDNVFDTEFTVDADGSYELDVLVGWNGNILSGPADTNFAMVELRDETNDQQLFIVSRSGSMQGTLGLLETVNLKTGISYSLRARSRVNGGTSTPGTYGVVAGWDFNLSESTLPFLLGDVNHDGVVNLLDIAPFVDAITGSTFIAAADINGDGLINLLDVAPFVDLLTGG